MGICTGGESGCLFDCMIHVCVIFCEQAIIIYGVRTTGGVERQNCVFSFHIQMILHYDQHDKYNISLEINNACAPLMTHVKDW